MWQTAIGEAEEVWLDEPRWSYFRQPLWRQMAMMISISSMRIDNHWNGGGGSLTTADFKPIQIQKNYVYFTPEEFVMFKLMDFNEFDKLSVMEIMKQGHIYA